MKTLITLIFGTALMFAQHTVAQSDKGYQEPMPISESVALVLALRATSNMTRKDLGLGFGKLPESWLAVSERDLGVHKKSAEYVIVSVFNAQEQKTLYVLMSSLGQVYDANLTGEFDSVE